MEELKHEVNVGETENQKPGIVLFEEEYKLVIDFFLTKAKNDLIDYLHIVDM